MSYSGDVPAREGFTISEQLPENFDNRKHIWFEMARIDQLIRIQVLRWRQQVEAGKPVDVWGMFDLNSEEVDAYLKASFTLPGYLPPEAERTAVGHLRSAQVIADRIEMQMAQTDRSKLRLEQLQCLFKLPVHQRDLILICLLPELDARYRRLFGYLLYDNNRSQPTVELALSILQPLLGSTAAGRAAFDPNSPLTAHHLLVMGGETHGDETLSLHSLRLDERITAYLLGSDAPDARLVGFLSEPAEQLTWEKLILPAEQAAHLRDLAAWMKKRLEDGQKQRWNNYLDAKSDPEKEQHAQPKSGATLFLHGPYGSSRLKAARAICAEAGVPLLRVDCSAALHDAQSWEWAVRLTLREAVLRGAAVYWSNCERLLDREQPIQRWDFLVAAIESFDGLTFLSSEVNWEPAGHFNGQNFLHLEFPAPSYSQRVKLWEYHLAHIRVFDKPTADHPMQAAERDELARSLANDFQFTEGQVIDALSTAQGEATARSPLQPRLTRDDLYSGCRRQSSRQLISFATRIRPRQGLDIDDLILPRPNKEQLIELGQRIQNRGVVYGELGFERHLSLGRGLVALFTGTSGTGKTMAAELLASKRGVDLYKVDLSAVASKWVGETEKNLSKVFSEAENANAILFFDEADALFGKRGEVKDAQDRWANMEVNFLLQRIEEYAGTVILASNLRQNLDDAFMRRIQVLVDFPFPDEKARAEIFRVSFSPSIEHPENLAPLAKRFRLAGGSIKNVVVDATFRAVAEGSQGSEGKIRVRARHLALGVAREYQKLGRPLTPNEFGPIYYPIVSRMILFEKRNRRA